MALAEPRIWPNDGLPDVGAPLAVPPVVVAALVALAPVVPVVAVPPPQDAAITSASARTAEPLFFTTQAP
jgi:hypothetical protein